jgi:perosamine synthetase
MIHPYRPNFDWHELLALLRPGAGRGEFESALAARVGGRYAIAFAYGRSGIIAVCKVLGLSEADIIMPAYTCRVVAEAVVVSGNRPVFVDIDLADYNMDTRALKEALTARTRAIIATHMHGYPADVQGIRAIAGDDRIIIIEDAALLGPLDSGSTGAGLSGDITIYSFSPGKHLYTVQGGIVVTNSSDLYERLKAYRDREMTGLSWKVWAKRLARLATGYMMLNASLFQVWSMVNEMGPMQQARNKLGLTKVDMPGDYATTFADFQGRVGLAQLDKFDSVLARHRAWAEFYDRELRDVPGIKLAPVVAGATYAQYTLRVERRDEIGFRQQMRARGIDLGTSFDYALPYVQPYRSYTSRPYPRADQAAREVVNLPNYAGLTARSAQHIVDSIRHALAENTRN